MLILNVEGGGDEQTGQPRDRGSVRDERAAAGRPDVDAEFLRDVLDGLDRPQKALLPKYFYDEEGSRLFDQICELPEYYVTRTELAILRDRAGELDGLVPDGAALVEPGAGSSVKVRILLDAMPSLSACVPLDISGEHLHASAARLAEDYPALDVRPVVGDFTTGIDLPDGLDETPKLLFFPGSTIGNFDPEEAGALLAAMRGVPGVVGLVIGVDLRKDPERLVAAYDDPQGVTAAFNLNLLTRMNRELGTDFDADAFRHEARWNDGDSRIEMHLVSTCEQVVSLDGARFDFAAGESIHTENSHKFSIESFGELAASAGWRSGRAWTDPERLFSVHLLTPG